MGPKWNNKLFIRERQEKISYRSEGENTTMEAEIRVMRPPTPRRIKEQILP